MAPVAIKGGNGEWGGVPLAVPREPVCKQTGLSMAREFCNPMTVEAAIAPVGPESHWISR